MVYGAFSEEIMRAAYKRLLESPMGERNLVDSAIDICGELDRFLVERLWPEKQKRQQEKQAKECSRKGTRKKNTPEGTVTSETPDDIQPGTATETGGNNSTQPHPGREAGGG